MAKTGYPDYQKPTNIVAQDLKQLKMDIVAQTIGELVTDVDTTKLSGLDIDVATQSLPELTTDVDTTKLDNLGIDVQAQTLTNMDMNVNAQTIAEVIQRPKQGTGNGTVATGTALPNDYGTVTDVYGKGVVYWGWVEAKAATDSHLLQPGLVIDTNHVITDKSFQFYSNRGYSNSGLTMNLIEYAVDGRCHFFFNPHFPLTFENMAELTVYNPTGTNKDLEGYLAYAIL